MVNKRLELFQSSYDDAIDTIKRFLEPNETPEIHELVKWMMETDANPYSYLPTKWAGAYKSAELFAELLHMIHHAVYDDGDITFVAVNGAPRIVFTCHDDDNFRNIVLCENERHSERNSRRKYKIEVLKITPAEFGPLYEAYLVNDTKIDFMRYAVWHGIEGAMREYKTNKRFDVEWIAEFYARKLPRKTK